MNVSLTLWVLTIVGLCALIAVDFFIGRKPHDVSVKEAGIWTGRLDRAGRALRPRPAALRRRRSPPASSSRASSPRSR